MYAIFESGSRQYKAEIGKTLVLGKIDAKEGGKVTFDKVLAVSDGKSEAKLGNPTLKNAKIEAKIVANQKSKKILVFKRKRRKDYRRTRGHRQDQTVVKIEAISAGS